MSKETNAPVMEEFKGAVHTLKNDITNLVAEQKKAIEEVETKGKENSDTIVTINNTIEGIKKDFEEKEKEYKKSFKNLESTIANINSFDNASTISKNVKQFNKVLQSHGKPQIQIEETSEIKAAFDKYITRGERMLNDSERKFINTIIDSDGGFLVVPEYNTVLEKKEFDAHGFMDACKNVVIGSNEYKTIVDWEDYDESFYENELDESTPTDSNDFKEVTINVTQQIYSKKFSRSALEDAIINIETEVMESMRAGMVRKDGNNLILGNGVDKPRGCLTFANGTTYGTVQQLAGVTDSGKVGWLEVLDVAPGGLKDAYHAAASYVMQRATFFKILSDKSGSDDFQIGSQVNFFDRAGVSLRLLGYPVVWEASMPAVASNSLSILFGDLPRFYTYVRRLGVSIIRNETNPRYIWLHLRQRSGGNVINFEAAKIVKTKA
jgi:HK97 family phage major capsid protein